MEIVISAQALELLIKDLRRDTEWGAALYLEVDASADRYLVREWDVVGASEVLGASATEITFAPQFLTRTTRKARLTSRSLVLLHTHPSGASSFSSIDDHAEQTLLSFMRERCAVYPSFSMILCDGQLVARVFGKPEIVPVRVVGSTINAGGAELSGKDPSLQFDRQIQAFGKVGQAILSKLTIAIVGLGGTGSVLAQQLAYLGVSSFTLVDPDTVEQTNLNRVVGADSTSIGRSKTDIAAEMILKINPSAVISRINESAISENGRLYLSKSHCIFICTDSHSSRAFLSELTYQYLIPSFDVGVAINAAQGLVKAITGRAQMLAPGLPCLLCTNSLDPRKIREELMTSQQRAADPYFNEGSVVQPAVISINSTMVSLTITMFLAAFTGLPSKKRWLSYDGIASSLRALSVSPDPCCAVCSTVNGVTGLGTSRRLSFLQ